MPVRAWFRRSLLPLLFAVLPQVAAAATHPGLFYGPGDLAALRAKRATHPVPYNSIRDGTQAHFGSTIARDAVVRWPAHPERNYATGDQRVIGDMLAVFSFAASVESDSAYFDLAHAWLTTVVGWSNLDLDGTHDLVQAHLLYGVCIAYDLLAPRLTETEKTAARNVIVANANALYQAGSGGIWWEREYLQNHNWIDHGAVGIAALVTRGEIAAATSTAWLTYARDNAAKVKQLLDQNVDGSWHEGVGYFAYGYNWHLPFVLALRRADGVDLGDVLTLRRYAAMRAHVQLPERPNQYLITNGDFSNFSPAGELAVLRHAARRYRDGLAQATADRWVAGTPTTTYVPGLASRIFEFLEYDPSVAASDWASVPRDWYGADAQMALFRSGWAPGSLLFALKSGTFGGGFGWHWQETHAAPSGGLNVGHDHADDNGFYFYGNGSWLAPEATGYYIGHADSPGPQANRAIFHNTLLVDGSGQLGEGVRDHGDEPTSYPWFPGRRGGVSKFGSSDDYGYAVGAGAQLYSAALGLTRWDRQILFVDRRYGVVRDAIESGAAHDYAWLCHFMNGATRDGNWLHGLGENGQALGVALVAPAQFNVTVSDQRPVHVDNFNPRGGVMLAQVTPQTRSASARFLAVLAPVAENRWADGRPTVQAIDPAHADAGLRIIDGDARLLAVFNDTPAVPRTVGSFTLTGEAAAVEYPAGAAHRAVLIQATRIADANGPLLTQASPTALLEADGLDTATLRLSGTGARPIRIHAAAATQVLWNGISVPFVRDGGDVVLPSTTTDLVYADSFEAP